MAALSPPPPPVGTGTPVEMVVVSAAVPPVGRVAVTFALVAVVMFETQMELGKLQALMMLPTSVWPVLVFFFFFSFHFLSRG